ncbi:MAG: aldehyde dehydrogenase EutE [Synergistaceae bacterium]|jgi:propionaldehyde dehydrogenase|nr:aldehyde dehydrogenase EutE [Synergistaceae bacterium]
MDEDRFDKLVRKILREEFGIYGANGVCRDINAAVDLSMKAFARYAALSLDERARVIRGIREKLSPKAVEFARMSARETLMGVVEDKAEKISLAIEKTPGVEDLVTEARTGDRGLTLTELSAWGVICAIHPCTNPCATLINNTIGMLAAGNAVIHIPHPRAGETTRVLVEAISESIRETCGIENLVVTLYESSMAAADELMAHPDIQMVVATGSGGVLRDAMSSGKKVIGAGPANPVAIVDETADAERAARSIVEGASFDNNLMCVTEKCVVAVNDMAHRLIERMESAGARALSSAAEARSLTHVAITGEGLPNKALEGRSAPEILDAAGISFSGSPRVAVFEAEKESPLAVLEAKMPVVPVVRARDFTEALEFALEIEQGFRHTAVIHSREIERLSLAAKAMQTAVFVKNGPSLAGIGMGGEGETSFTIATATGEGLTTARSFARRRRCALVESFSIR